MKLSLLSSWRYCLDVPNKYVFCVSSVPGAPLMEPIFLWRNRPMKRWPQTPPCAAPLQWSPWLTCEWGGKGAGWMWSQDSPCQGAAACSPSFCQWKENSVAESPLGDCSGCHRAQSPLLSFSLHAQDALEVIFLNEVGTAFQLKLLCGSSQENEVVFRFMEHHGPLAALHRRSWCVLLLSHSAGQLGWQRTPT